MTRKRKTSQHREVETSAVTSSLSAYQLRKNENVFRNGALSGKISANICLQHLSP